MQETAQQYIQRILGYVEGQDAIKVQRATAAKLKKLIHGLTPKQLKWKPEPGKWSIAEIVAHLADAEIVGSWRMRSAASARVERRFSPLIRMCGRRYFNTASATRNSRSKSSAFCARTIWRCSRRFRQRAGTIMGCILSAAKKRFRTWRACSPGTTPTTSCRSRPSLRN